MDGDLAHEKLGLVLDGKAAERCSCILVSTASMLRPSAPDVCAIANRWRLLPYMRKRMESAVMGL